MPLIVMNVALGIAAFGLSVVLLRRFLRTKRHLPPGPSGFPLLGNALQIPKVHPWLKYTQWSKTYGDLVYVDAIGQPILIVNYANVALDLMDKRSTVYSDRPHLVMAGELSGWLRTFVLKPYGEEWRKQRRMMGQDFSPSTVPRYHHLQETEAQKLIRSIIEDPTTLERQVKWRISTIILRVTFGYSLVSEGDPFLAEPLQGMENFSRAASPGAWLVDFIPQLKYLPGWMPGTGFLRTAQKWYKHNTDTSWAPYIWSKENMDTGLALTPNLCTTVIGNANGHLSPQDEERLVFCASSVMGGGMDTNMATIMTFFLAMVLHPEVQKKARAEIDTVIRSDRLPLLTDRQSLPYVRSVVTEVMRWLPAVPLGLPHSTSQDDVYEGFFVPKDSIVIPNVWNMTHDPEIYSDSMDFRPERYNNEDSEMKKVTDLVFGFGRRVCPGMYFAEGTVFAIVATALATCDILPAFDKSGKFIQPNYAYSQMTGAIMFPEDFRCDIKCRSTHALTMLSEAADSIVSG